MADVIKMPRMSDTMEEGVIVAWLKEEGEDVEIGETLAEVETDKATMELDSYYEGKLLHIAVRDGSVPIDGVIAVIGQEGEDWEAAIKADAADGASSPARTVAHKEAEMHTEAPKTDATPVVDETAKPAAEATSDERIKASPLAKSIAKEAGLDLSAIQGSGDQGRIIKKDIEAAMSNGMAKPAAPAPAAAAPETTAKASPAAPAAPQPVDEPQVLAFAYDGTSGKHTDTPVSQMRKTIARRLGESKFSAPHFYLTIEINMDAAFKMRKQINEVAPVKISFNDIIIKACAIGLRQHPDINSSWMGDSIRQNNDVNIGVAVAVPEGLLVPVVKLADIKTLSQINTEVKTLAGKARNRKLSPAEMTGNTFTISNLGMFGIEDFTAIINPPDACILAVGAIVQKPVVQDGEITIGNRMKVTLSCDHRVVDGAKGAIFLNTIKDALENPLRFMI